MQLRATSNNFVNSIHGTRRILFAFLSLTLFSVSTHAFTAPAKTGSPSPQKKSKIPNGKTPSKKKLPGKSKSTPSKMPASESPALQEPSQSDHPSIEILMNGGLAPSPILSYGGTFGYFVGPTRSAFEVSASYGLKEEEIIAVSALQFGVRYRLNFLTAPYIALGLGYRSHTAMWNALSEDQTKLYETTAQSSAITVDSALGLQFHFGLFALGIDLAGIQVPISKTEQATTPESPYLQSDYDTQMEAFNKYNGMGITLGKLGIGLVF